MDERIGVPGTGLGLALPSSAVLSHYTLPVTVREPHTDSHRTGVRWNCNPEILHSHSHSRSGFLRVYAEEDVKHISVVIHLPETLSYNFE
jgi:hypothetical protein